jgi:hypothetical protein
MTKRVDWITTIGVVTAFGFDPSPYVERDSAGKRFIHNKLVANGMRVWLLEDVERHPLAKPVGEEASHGSRGH